MGGSWVPGAGRLRGQRRRRRRRRGAALAPAPARAARRGFGGAGAVWASGRSFAGPQGACLGLRARECHPLLVALWLSEKSHRLRPLAPPCPESVQYFVDRNHFDLVARA